MGLNKRERKTYVSILASDGTLRQSVQEGTENSVKREYETKDGKKGVKYELVYDDLDGYITDIAFFDGDYGKQLQITVDDGTDEVVLALNSDSRFASDIMKKLPNIDFSEPLKVAPYSFTGNDGDQKKGVNLYQGDVKVLNHFYDEEAGKPINGFPEKEDRDYDNDDWKVFFIGVQKFLIKYTLENIVPKLESARPNKLTEEQKAEIKSVREQAQASADDDYPLDDSEIPF